MQVCRHECLVGALQAYLTESNVSTQGGDRVTFKYVHCIIQLASYKHYINSLTDLIHAAL